MQGKRKTLITLLNKKIHRMGFLGYFCPNQGQDFKPSAAPIYAIMG